MKFLRQIIEAISCWIDSVAATINSIFERMRSQRRVQLLEEERDTFTFHLLDNVKRSNLPDHRVRISSGSIVGTLAAKLGVHFARQPDRTGFAAVPIPVSAA